MKSHPSFPALAVAAACMLLQNSSASALPADVLFFEDFENPDVPSYSQGITPDIWVRAAAGYGSGDHGMTDKSGGDFSSPVGNEQAYAFRYSNSGITTKEFALGPPLVFGGGYEVSFDVVKDNSTSGKAYSVKLIAFGAGAIRSDCRSIPTGSTQLATATGNAPADGSIVTVTFTFIPNATTHAAEFGKDIGIRVIGTGSSAIIDNIRFKAIPGTSTGLNLVTTSPIDNSSNNLANLPAKAIFNKNIAAGSGNITLRNLTDAIDTVIPVGDPRILITGTCLNIEAGAPYTWGKNYAVRIDAGAVVEATPGTNSFTGIADDTTWNFTMAGGDPLLYSISRLKDHITGTITLTAAEIDTIKKNLDTVVGRFAESSDSITALLDLINTYDTGTITGRKGPLWVTQSLPKRDVVTNDLHWTIFNVMQNIMDRIYTAQTLAAHENLLNGFKFRSSSNFPGNCTVPDPSNVHTATISASYLKTYGPPIIQDGPGTYARKPTGCYLSPGTIATVTVPASMVNTGYKIRVGCHSWDFSAKPDIKRLDRVTRVYDITSTSTRIANPLGGGIYIEVPWLANAGVVNVDITGAARSPYFSAKSFHQTTTTEWESVERSNPGPWADFQTDKFMMQVPKNWVSAMTGVQATQLMADWDAAMDAVNDLMGYTYFNPATGSGKYIRGKETMYPQVDLLLKNSVYAPGYPSVNTTYSPTSSYNGYVTSHLVRGPQNAPDYEFHEQGHGYLFPKFGGESESAVNLLHVAVMNRKFGKTMDTAFRGSRGSTNTFQTLDTTAIAWMCVFNFSPREVPMADGEKAYQLKGHAKFVDIANLYGWDVLSKFWGVMVDNEEKNIAYATDTDSMLLRLCKAVGKDIRPLFHFWGIYPSNPTALAAAIAAENIPADPAIKNRLLYYKTLVPADNAAFRTFAKSWWGNKQPSINGYWEEREHARQWDQTALFGAGDQQRADITINEEYIPACADQIRNRVQELVDLYFPNSIAPSAMSFAIAPSAVDATTIGMTATTATSSSQPVEYYFENITNNTNSGWISSASWYQSGLITGQSYAYRVKARDGLLNETAWSLTASATAQEDATPPSPSPMTFATPPAATGLVSISMTASTATDINGVEYFFDCLTPGGHDSGWQDSPNYTDTGLNQSTEYFYQVQARDKSPAQNVTAFSATASATTPTPDTTPPAILSLNPADNATDIPVDGNLVITFNELIGPNTGTVTLKNLSDATQTVIDINDDTQITISGSDLTINPSLGLVSGKSYAVRIDAAALQDLSGNPFAGINDDTTWNFTAVVVPYVWTETSGGPQDWTTGTNWQGGNVPNPTAVDTVDFSSANITANTTLTLGADRTAKLWKFGDATTASHDWIVNAGNSMILAGTTPTIQVVNRTATLNNVVDGTAGLTKTGTGTLALANTANTYTGGTTINAGNVTIAGDGSLGASGTTVTVNANCTMALPASPFTFNRPFVLNNGAILSPSFTSSVVTVNGAVTGTGSIAPYNQSGASLTLAGTANTFTGNIQLGSGIQQGTLIFNSIGDGGIVYLGAQASSGNNYGQANFRYGTGATAPLVLNIRQFQLGTAGGGKGVIQNDNTTSTNTITINTDLLAPNAGARTLELAGVNTGNNVFAGKIIDGNGTVSVQKNGAGRWILTGANTHSGGTSVVAGGGTLVIQGTQAAPSGGTITLNQNSSSSSALRLLADGSGTINFPTNIAFDNRNSTTQIGLLIGNTGNGSGSGTTTGATIAINKLRYITTQGAASTLDGPSSITSPNGYLLQAGGVEFAANANVATNWNCQLTPTTTSITVTGTVQQLNGNTATTKNVIFKLDGTSSGNSISGNILDAADYTDASNANARELALTKANTSTWTLSGTNNYTGPTTVSAGKLFINGDQTSATGAVSVSANATLGGKGVIGGTTTIAANGKLEFDISTAPGIHDKLDLASGKALNFSGASTLTITSTSGANTGTYTLLTAPGGITWTTAPTVVLPAGWTAGTPQIAGLGNTDLVINITSTGVASVPEIAVEQPAATDIASGDSKSFGTVTLGSNTSLTFTIRNTGTANLNLTGTPLVAVSGTNAADFTVTATPTTPVTSSGGTTTFTVQFTPGGAGARSAVLTIANNDSDEGSFTINISGTGQTPYEAWAGGVAFDADANGDGVKNGLAWILGAANPSASALGLLPAVSTSGGNLIFTFKRNQASINAGTALAIEVGANLAAWTGYNVGADTGTSSPGVTVAKDSPAPGTDTVTLSVAQSPDTRKFARLKAMQTP